MIAEHGAGHFLAEVGQLSGRPALVNGMAVDAVDALLIPPVKLSLEQALEFIDDDELVEVTPKQIRLRKKFRTENDRKRASRAA